MLKKFTISILRPGGNDTAIVDAFVPEGLRKGLNKEIISKFPNVEQCGFFEQKKGQPINFNMMGGEFSGNAMLAITYLVLKGKSGNLNIKSSGSNQILRTGIKNKMVFSQIPIYKNPDSVKQFDDKLFLVKLKGITHLVVYQKISRNRILNESKELLKQYNLNREVCSGCIFVEAVSNDKLKIDPVVWIRNVETLTYETACGSGTVAVGLSILKNNQKNQIKLKIKQPSGNFINVIATKNRNSFKSTLIEGKVKLLMTNQNIYL